jgi:hypothetical protein
MTDVEAAQLLSKLLGRRVPPDEIGGDRERGAPSNADGTVDLVQYSAWMAKREGESR